MTLTVEACPRCGDQTLWSHYRSRAWCRLCGHTWPYVFRCDDPEGEWILDQQQEAK
jgi:uncharacterized protein (DUF983 family)